MAMEMKLVGFEGLDEALGELTRATGKNAVRRGLVRAGAPLAGKMNAAAPRQAVDEDGARLAESYAAGTKLNRSQTKARRREGRDDVEVYIGTNNAAGLQQEFGNTRHGPQPHARPAWESDKADLLKRVGEEIGTEIDKAVARARRKAAGS